MPSCVVKLCKNRSELLKKQDGISFHIFPKDELRKRKWINLVCWNRMEEFWQPSPHSVICSDHFKKEDFYLTKKGFRRLNKKASPVLLVPKLNNSEKRNDQSKSKFTPSKGKRKDVSLRSLEEELRKKGSIKEDLYFELSKNFVAGDHSNKFAQIKRQKQKISSEYVPKQSFNMRKFCLSLQFYSPSAYNQARFALGYDLPHPRALNKWYERTDANAGFTAEAFKILKEKSSKENLVCSLIVGEMAIRQQRMWTGKKYEGLVNNGFSWDENGDLASQAYVLMVVSLSENWKLPVGYFLIKSLTAEQRANVIKICLQKCHDNGVRIVSLTFDACNANLCAGTVLGCNLNDHKNLKVTFPHPSTGKEIVIFPDPCRMLKLVHKVFVIKRVLIDRDGRFIKWDYVNKLDSLQGNKQLHFCDKSKLVFYENQLMKVRLATQLLSKSVADTLKFCEMHMKLNDFAGCAATFDFIYVMNNLFDVLNSNYHQKYLKEPLSLRSEKSITEFLDFAKTYIASLKMNIYTKQIIQFGSHPVLVRTKEKQKLLIESKKKIGFLGLLCCIESVKILHKNLLNSKILDRIPFQRLSKNHLESFFVDLRQHTGTSNDPNAIQFKDGYRKFLNGFRKSSNFIDNTIPFTYIATRAQLSSVSIINSTCDRLRFNEDEYDFTYVIRPDYGDKIETGNCEIFSETLDSGGYRFVEDVKQIVGYISGWVVKKLNNDIKCEECVNSLMACEKLPFHKLISSKNAGGLMYPSLDVFIICRRVESVIRDLMKRNDSSIFVCRYTLDYIMCSALKEFINYDIFNSLNEHSFEQSALGNHRLHLIRAIIYQYVDIRLLYLDKSLSVNMSKWKINNKLLLFERQ